jgi:hypothetical protein
MRPIPLVHHLLDHVVALPELKTDRSFRIFPAGVALHPQVHLLPLSLCERLLSDMERFTLIMDKQLQRGIRLFNDEEFFQCHEVLEETWTSEHEPRRLFLQALIHLAVGLYHCQRGKPVGASRQLRKGLRKLDAYMPSCEGIDTGRLYRDALAALEQIDVGVPLSAYPKIHTSSVAGS